MLDSIPEPKIKDVTYIPVDISESAVRKSVEILSQTYKGIKIHGLTADFMKHMTYIPGNSPRLICFLGSTLGNLTFEQSIAFIMNLKQLMNTGDTFLLGLDMVKDPEILHHAYNDKSGVTARFNKNILNVVNRLAQTDFNPEDFEHVAFYNEKESRAEMHLKALKNVTITSTLFPAPVTISEHETVHTENSHKFTREKIELISSVCGLNIKDVYTDDNNYFSLIKFTL